MQSIFVASSFSERDRSLVNAVNDAIEAIGARPLAGRNLGGQQLEAAVKQRIEAADGLIALFTRRKEKDKWITHPWVLGEFGHAVSVGKPAIALVEKAVSWNSMYAGREHISLTRTQQAEAMFALVRQLGAWKRDAGATLQVAVSQPEIIQQYMSDPNSIKVRYRSIAQANFGQWRDAAQIYREANALAVALPGIGGPDHLIELDVSCAGQRWTSAAARQMVQVGLTKVTP